MEGAGRAQRDRDRQRVARKASSAASLTAFSGRDGSLGPGAEGGMHFACKLAQTSFRFARPTMSEGGASRASGNRSALRNRTGRVSVATSSAVEHLGRPLDLAVDRQILCASQMFSVVVRPEPHLLELRFAGRHSRCRLPWPSRTSINRLEPTRSAAIRGGFVIESSIEPF